MEERHRASEEALQHAQREAELEQLCTVAVDTKMGKGELDGCGGSKSQSKGGARVGEQVAVGEVKTHATGEEVVGRLTLRYATTDSHGKENLYGVGVDSCIY